MPPVVRVHARSRRRADDNVDHEHMPSEPAITFIRPEQLTTKAPYAYAALTGPGQHVFTAGACPLDADGNTIAVGDVAGQTHQVIANLVAALQAAGALTDVVKTTIYVASSQQTDLGTAWHVVRATFGEHDAPARCSASASWATTTSWSRSRRSPSVRSREADERLQRPCAGGQPRAAAVVAVARPPMPGR